MRGFEWRPRWEACPLEPYYSQPAPPPRGGITSDPRACAYVPYAAWMALPKPPSGRRGGTDARCVGLGRAGRSHTQASP